MINNKRIFYIISLFLTIPLFYLSCSCKSTPLEGEVTFLAGTMKINSTYASVGSRVIKGDMLITGDKSEAIIQLSESAVITLKPDTEMIFENLSDGTPGSGTASLLLNKGTSLHKVLKSGSEYSVKAPTAVASVRGTEFEMTADETRTIIKVTSGTVYVRKISENTRADKSITDSQHKGVEEIILREGDSLQIYTLGAGARGHSDRSAATTPGIKKTGTKAESKTGITRKDKASSAKSTVKSTSKSKTVSGKKQAAIKDSGESTVSAKKRDTAAGTKDSKKTSGLTETDKTSGSGNEDSGISSDSIAENDKAATDKKTGTSAEKKDSATADAAKKKSSAADTTAKNKTDSSSTDSGSSADRISKSTDIAGGKEKTPDPDAVRTLINKKDRNLNDIKKVYNRIDRVHLYSGKIITGAITERGDTYSIITTEGMVKVSKKDIQSNDIIK